MLFMPHDEPTRGISGIRRERGQAYIEFILTFPLMVILFLFIAVQAWWWWNQASAAVAIHDGTAAAAYHGGSWAEGHQETFRALAAPLGRSALEYGAAYFIVYMEPMRSTAGYIHNERVIALPYIGAQLFTVEASSFQRTEQFYPGPPDYFE
jgi:hypothetical protein